MVLLVLVCPLWAPWSGGWNKFRAVRAHAKGDYRTALNYYERGMALGQDKVGSLQNIALCYYALGNTNRYHELLETLRGEDVKAAGRVEAEILKHATNN
jgi:thioredoxin-like negative regulator of GroEL